jgi:hypothetical protein
MRLITSLFLVVVIIVLTLSMILKPAMGQNKNIGIEIGSEGEIPTLMKNSGLISGFSSNTLYLRISSGREEHSPHSLVLSFNATCYGLYQTDTDQGTTRGYAYLMGWWPVNPILWAEVSKGPGGDYINLLSPAAGYSYVLNFSQITEISATANVGVSYGRIEKPDLDLLGVNDPYNAKRIRSYNVMKDINKKYGCRLNAKLKFAFLISSFRLGVSAGLTQYIFSQNNFNSYDIGTFVSFVF